MQFTLATMRSPASVRETAGDLRFRLPVIVMDGAALYDMAEKRYLHTCPLPKDAGPAVRGGVPGPGDPLLSQRRAGRQPDDLLREFRNDAEREIFEKLRTSPYRNYVSRRYFQDCPILYLTGIDRTERMEALYARLEAAGLLERGPGPARPRRRLPGVQLSADL